MSNAVAIVAAAANTNDGRRALAEILSDDANVALVEEDALSYLRISRDVPLPEGVEDQRIDAYFRDKFYTGTRLTKTHRLQNPKEFLYFNIAVGMITGTLDDVDGARKSMEGSGYEPVIVHMPGGVRKAIGTVMVNEFRDTTFGPYNEVIFAVTAVPQGVPEPLKSVRYVNPFSLQTPVDRGATLYLLKLWLDQLSPVDGGNDFLGTNKELAAFVFKDSPAGTREFQSVDRYGKALARGVIPRTITPIAAVAAQTAYREASTAAGTSPPASSLSVTRVASRPDHEFGKPATPWAFEIDWRHPALQEVTPERVDLRLGDSEWGRRFASLRMTPMLTLYGAQCVGQIYQKMSDIPPVVPSPPARKPAGNVGAEQRQLEKETVGEMDFHARLAHYRDLVGPLMLEALPEIETSRYLYEPIRGLLDRNSSGLRAALCIATCKAFGGDEKAALPTAAALELLHQGLEVHYDVEDESLERRGQPTLNKRYGLPVAVNIGDAMNALVLHVLMKNLDTLSPNLSWQIIEEFNHLLLASLEGQAMELGWIRDKEYGVREDDYLAMILKKTCYGFIHPCRLGALIAGEGELERFDPFGYLTGLAFQIQSDLLGGRWNARGKKLDGDLREGKRTLMLSRAFETLSGREGARFQEILAKPRSGVFERDVNWMNGVLEANGSNRYAKDAAAEFAGAAREEFEKAYAGAPEGQDKRFLRQFSDYTVQRVT
jgi:geranylgeranyl diphosphate synthase type II